MRINLNVSYPQKDEAKALGARWDAARKTWYIVDIEDLTPFMRWIERPNAKQTRRDIGLMKAKAKILKPATTSSAPIYDCGCDHIPPWEHCEHTEAEEQREMLSAMSIQ